jgi:two-component system chemotaxis sensor kinase CheA
MSQIFTQSWFDLNSKAKTAQLEESLLGLKPIIIYLDDEPEALEIFEQKCREFGFNCFATSEASKAIGFLNKNKARTLLMISDYRMPQATGFDFREKVLEISPDIPFYILSGYIDRNLAMEGIKYKITGFIEKPFKSDAFIEILKGEGENRAQVIKDEYEMLKSFTDDVVNIVAEIEDSCLSLESDPNDTETIAKIFGLVHTIKGSSGFFDPRTLHLFGHEFEEILKQVQAGTLAISSNLISSWLKAADVIKMLNEEFISGEHKDHNVNELKKVLHLARGEDQIVVDSDSEKDTHHSTQTKTDAKKNEIKVSTKVLDEFNQVSGELTVIRNMINKIVGSIEKNYRGDKDVLALGELLDEMHKINSEVQNKITDIRRVSANQLVKPLTRNLRDTCKALGKEVDFVVEGDEARIDNAIADTLSRSLVHLMRNSLDHGLEGNEERVKLGKPRKGQVVLKFEIRNETIVVSIRDDGRGINTEKIKEKILSKNLKSPEEMNQMTAEELHLMIFEAGFSTAQQVTEFSGRGVGMSMVKETIEEVNGKIGIKSVAGQGTTFSLEIPIPKSVQIIDCLFVSASGMTLGVPQEFIVKVLDRQFLLHEKIDQLDGSDFIRFDGYLVPIVSLAKVLDKPCSEEDLLIILNAHGKMMALRVSSVHDIEDAVIKPLNVSTLKKIGLYLGGTFLGDGTVGLVLDIDGLSEKLQLSLAKKKADETKVKNDYVLESIISFSFEERGEYCVLEKDVFRVESFSIDRFTKSGDHYVMPYRESIMTLVELEKTIFKDPRKHQTSLLEQFDFKTIIVKHTTGYLGLVVKDIKDLEQVEFNLVGSLRKRSGIRGNIIHSDKTYTLLDMEEVKSSLVISDDGNQPNSNYGVAA